MLIPKNVIMTKPTITVIGSLNTDLITRTTRIPSAGETLLSQSFDTGSGGKGANQAVACARLSRNKDSPSSEVSVRMIGAVGDDTFGQDLLSGLQNNGIYTYGIAVKKGEKSGVAVIIVEEETGENRILMSPNANFSLRPEQFTNLPAPVPDLIVLQLEIPLDTTLQILKVAKEKGVEVLLNPAPAQELPRGAWEAVTHLIVNESEAAIITNTTDPHVSWREWGEHIERIVALGVPHVTITLGREGVVYLDTRLRKRWEFPAKKVNVVDTTAAGDTFVGAYAVGLMKQKGGEGNVPRVIKWANDAAAKTVERRGAQGAIPWVDEVESLDVGSHEGGVKFGMWAQR